MKLRSPAKINLLLEILGKREDGYHEVETWMTPVSLFDRLTLEPAGHTQVHCEHPDVPSGEANIIHKTIEQLERHTGRSRTVRVTVEKRIPPGTGLGGGSSNAATCLRALNRMGDLCLDPDELRQIGASIGADVNFFLSGGSALCRGRGEQIDPAPLNRPLEVLLIIPEIRCKTVEIYQNLGEILNFPPGRVSVLKQELDQDWNDRKLMNRLQSAAFHRYPALEDLFRTLDQATERTPLMTGSGSAFFLAAPDPDGLRDEAERLSSLSTSISFDLHRTHTLPLEWDPFETN